MNRTFPLTLLLLLTSLTAWSQHTIHIVDENKLPVPYACVKIKSPSGTVENVIFSNREGQITINKQTDGNQLIAIDALGYSTYETRLTQIPATVQLEPRSEILQDIVVTGQHAPTTAEAAVHDVRVIQKSRIEQMGANNVSEILSKELNLRSYQDNVLGSQMEMQGVSGQNIKVLIDGVPVVGRLDGNIDLSQIDANSVERIEVIKGPLSVQYGTDALGGTINIITKPNTNVTAAQIKTYYESVGQYNTHLNLNLGTSKHQVKFNGGRQYFDGWSNGDPQFQYLSEIISDSSRFQTWKPKLQWMGRLNYDYNPRQNLNIGLGASIYTEEMTNRGLPRGPYGETAFDDIYQTDRNDASIRVNWKTPSNSQLNILTAYNYYNRTKNTFVRNLTNLDSELSSNSGDQDTTRFDSWMSRGTWSSSADSNAVRYSLGYDMNMESTVGRRIENGRQQITNIAGFTDVEWNITEALILRPGVRFGYNSTFEIPVIPSFQLRWGKRENVMRFSYARGFRSPSLKELYFDFVDINHDIHGNTSLLPEDGHNFRVSFHHNHTFSGGRFNWWVESFYNDIQNLISLAQTGSSTLYSYVNIGEFQSMGINLGTALSYEQWSIDLGVAYTGQSGRTIELAEEPVLYSPEIQSTLKYFIPSINLNLSLFYKYNGVQLGYGIDSDDQVYQTRIDDYHSMDLTASTSFFKRKLKLTAGAKNLFNVTLLNATSSSGAHSGGGSIPQNWGRSYFIGLSYTIGK
ncbi:TonB-dependent receptor plug domain-containing protein [Phaeocystidibacter marisrubri]|uniref:TonB-dependent receptor n=1 Tax=Phaeocystidibacter marisrubri TaxID=1577780 RepID=A0A6L3ZKY1_9FLAO|nr:TonB-dependent receptor [Phaeocystidibacter marisrubri]KAB2818188.1 TonB-dependent receptor [Phaeocystidibacter marisrubri]GGH71485.1 TonB-dependent receptor [Phaeocystidibacter marisrubri]